MSCFKTTRAKKCQKEKLGLKHTGVCNHLELQPFNHVFKVRSFIVVFVVAVVVVVLPLTATVGNAVSFSDTGF